MLSPANCVIKLLADILTNPLLDLLMVVYPQHAATSKDVDSLSLDNLQAIVDHHRVAAKLQGATSVKEPTTTDSGPASGRLTQVRR